MSVLWHKGANWKLFLTDFSPSTPKSFRTHDKMCYGKRYVWHKKYHTISQVNHPKNPIATVKHGGVSIMI